MRLLFISNLYPPFDLGGLEQRCQEVADRLRDRGHIIQVLTSGPQQDESDRAKGVVRSLFLEADLNYYRPMDFFLKHSTRESHNLQELRQCIDSFEPDAILIWGMWNLSSNLAYWAEQWAPGRVAYNIASYWPMEKNVHEEYWQLPARHGVTEWIKRPFRAAALGSLPKKYPFRLQFEHAFCASEYVRDILMSAGILPETSSVIYPGIDPDPLMKALPENGFRKNETLRLLYFGSLVPHKGVHTAIEAVGHLKERGLAEGIELTILGGGHPAYEKKLQSLTHELGIEERVQFIGKVPRDEIPLWLRRFDVFLFTSTWPEPIAATVMEAMAARLLVIGTEVGGQTEMLFHGQNALTFKAGDAEALAEHIKFAAENQEERDRLSLEGKASVLERFTLVRMVNEIEQYLQDMIRTPQVV